MAKPTQIVVPSDDCLVTVNGEQYAPHEGETVTVVPGLSVGALNAVTQLMAIAPQIDAARGEPDEQQRLTEMSDGAMQQLCRALAPRVVAWTWTDPAGRPLPQPDGTPGPLQALETEELAWLITACKGETPSARKNG